ncbi:hypothetical protein [Vallitalea sp.]|jgi:hypothetical protein|uniref:hypothetical protein n=1 Tax=Vallitalea sp. TaxID=1882829 RepID=UPI0025FC19B5|nr:hypothetical protein [Vallitalea sp.]MCT4686654.1 hypothetical protein [Vallitalea sp.]
MKKKLKRVLCLLLTCTIIISYNTANVSAKELSNKKNFEFVDNSGELIRIELYEEGNKIIGKQYKNNILMVEEEAYKNSNIIKIKQDGKISYKDCSANIYNIPAFSANNIKSQGNYIDTLTYQVSDHRIDLYLEKGPMRETIYNVQNELGNIIDIAMILAGAVAIPLVIINAYISVLIYNSLIFVVGGAIKSWKGIKSLNVDAVRYTWYSYDADDHSTCETQWNDVYTIKESTSTLIGQVYGTTEDDIYEQEFKATCYMLLWPCDFDNPANIY